MIEHSYLHSLTIGQITTLMFVAYANYQVLKWVFLAIKSMVTSDFLSVVIFLQAFPLKHIFIFYLVWRSHNFFYKTLIEFWSNYVLVLLKHRHFKQDIVHVKKNPQKHFFTIKIQNNFN